MVSQNGEVKLEKIKFIDDILYKGWVYDFEVNIFHNYIANNILTHNTCSAIGAIEKVKNENSTFNGALILAKGSQLLDNFLIELAEKCTGGDYLPENYKKLTSNERMRRIKKNAKFYQLKTFAKFAKKLSKISDSDIQRDYSNKVIVIDEVHNLRPQEKSDKEALEIYNQIHRLLHNIKNSKVLLLSGTPMKDTIEEIATVTNLLVSLKDQLPIGEKFFEEFTKFKDGVYSIKKDKINIIKEKLKGKISFLREPESTIEKQFLGEDKYGGLKHFTVNPLKMSSHQTKGYRDALEKDKSGKKGVYINSREASLFVYPDKSYGKAGYQKYIIESKKGNKYRLNPEIYEILKGEDDMDTLERIRKYSVSYANVIENILKTEGNCFVYSSLAQGSGAILFSLLLELFGFSKATGKETEKGLRYAIMTNKTTSIPEIRRLAERFNRTDNVKGEYIKVIIGSKTVSEGFSFKNIVYEAINTPHWNYSETAQALSRGIRLGSHNELYKLGENPVVKISQNVAIPKDGSESIDLLMYKTSEDKDISIRSVLRILMENAFDCALNYMRNYIDSVDGSRECDYTKCSFKCDGIDMANVWEGIEEDKLDLSTYNLYYSNPKISEIKKRIEDILREIKIIDIDSILKNLSDDFSEEEIFNALFLISEETGKKEFDYKTFINIYHKSPVQRIRDDIEELFRYNFIVSFEGIRSNFTDISDFDILLSLQSIIEEDIQLTDKYGFPCYLRENNNNYFLVNSISIKGDIYSEYYTRNPHIITDKKPFEVLDRIQGLSLIKLSENLCTITDFTKFSQSVKAFPVYIQEYLIESAITAKDSGKIGTFMDNIIKFYESYIKNVNGTWVSIYNQTGIRCKEPGKEWRDCGDEYIEMLKDLEKEKRQKLKEENKYGIMGKYNPENNTFCLVDFDKEREKGSKKGDSRLIYTGKVCTRGWTVDNLLNIAVERLKIDPPKDFRIKESLESLLDKAKSEKKLLPYIRDDISKKELRRLLYWGTTKKEGGVRGIQPICGMLKKWFEDKGLIEIDNQCGVKSKIKAQTVVEKRNKPEDEKKTTRVFRIEYITPSKNSEEFKAYSKDISKLMGECFGVEKYRAPVDDNNWIMIFSRKKLVGFLTIDSGNTIWNVCVAKNYRRQGIAKQAMRQATSFACDLRGKTPNLLVDNRDKNSKKLIKMYTGFGFTISKSDERYTYMSFDCK
jgi:GNAT superfamily N-acetyltransferase